MNIHGAAVTKVVKAPDFVQQLIAGIDPVGRRCQVEQQLHFLGRRVHLLAIHHQFESVHIDGHLVEHQMAGLLLCGSAAGTAEHCLDPGQNFPHFKGLGHIVIRAGTQAGDLVLYLTLGGEHDDGGLCFGTDGLAQSPAIHHRHHHVQQHQIRLDAPEFAQALAAVKGGGHGIAFLFQIHLQQFSNITVVLNDQNGNSHKNFLHFPIIIYLLYYTAKYLLIVNKL